MELISLLILILELPKMFQDVSDKNMELMCEEDELRNGGAAMTAYARAQYEEMSDYERSEIKKGFSSIVN